MQYLTMLTLHGATLMVVQVLWTIKTLQHTNLVMQEHAVVDAALMTQLLEEASAWSSLSAERPPLIEAVS